MSERDQSQRQIFELWVELSRARYRKDVFEQEMKTNPWESNDLQVKAAWDKLTQPINLAALEQWGSEPQKMNPAAQHATAKAIECCRLKAKGVSA